MGRVMKHYDLKIPYHPEKANMVADALSHKSANLVEQLMVKEWCLLEQVAKLNAEFRIEDKKLRVSCFREQSLLISGIQEL